MIEYKLETKAIYINFPFCKHACSYCHYVPNLSFEVSKIPDEYIELVIEELKQRQISFQNQKLESLYLGGGTPSLLTDKQLDIIFSFFAKANTRFKEKSIEVHPTDVNFDIINDPYFTRYSVGIQSLDDTVLSKYNRKYNHSTVSTLLAKIKSRPNITLNIDFIFQSTFNVENLSEIITYRPDTITIYPDTRGKGIKRLINIYDTLDKLRLFFASTGMYKELGHSGFIYIYQHSAPSWYAKVQNEFRGNIIGIGNNAISDIDDKSSLSVYKLVTKTIIYKERYTKGRFIKTLISSAAVGITKRMIDMAMPKLLETNLLHTLENKPIHEKHVIITDDDLIYIPEYNYNLFYDFLYNEYGEEYAAIFLNYISYGDSSISAKEFFDCFNFRIDKSICLHNAKGLINKKKQIPDVRILIEGIDGSGKDTFAALLADALKKRFYLEPGRSISIVGQPVSRLSHGEKAKKFIEERKFDNDMNDVVEDLTINRLHSEEEFSKTKGILICIRGILTDLATLKAVFHRENSSLLGLKSRYDYAFIITIDPKIAYERVIKRKAPKQWRESLKWLKFFQHYYETYPLEHIAEKTQVIYNDDLSELQKVVNEIADEIYISW